MAGPAGSPWRDKKEYQLGKGPRLIICLVADKRDWPELHQRGRPEPLMPIAVVYAVANPRLWYCDENDGDAKLAEELLGKHLLRPGIRCPRGEAVVTKSYNPNVDWIIQTCGPSFFQRSMREECERVMTGTYRNSLARAQQLGVRCIAFHSIVMPFGDYTLKEAVRLALSVLRDAEYPLEEVWLVLDRTDLFIYATAAASVLGLSEYVPPAQPPTSSGATLGQGAAHEAQQQAGVEPALQPLAAAAAGALAAVVAPAPATADAVLVPHARTQSLQQQLGQLAHMAGARPRPLSPLPAAEGVQQRTAEGAVPAQQPEGPDAAALLGASEPQHGSPADSTPAVGGQSAHGSSRAKATLPSDAADDTDEAADEGGMPAAGASATSPAVVPPLLLAPQGPGLQPPLPGDATSISSLASRPPAEAAPPMLPVSPAQQTPLLLGPVGGGPASSAAALQEPQHMQLPNQPSSPSAQHLQQQQGEPPLEYGNVSDEAELRRLGGSADFVAEQEQDSTFTLLHYLALLGRTTLQEALEVAAKAPGELQRFARLASCLINKQQQQQQALAIVDAQDKYGCTPLQLAAACGNVDMVNALIAPYGLHDNHALRTQALNHKDLHIRYTALHGAVSLGQLEVALLLLVAGADPGVRDSTNMTAFEVAPSHAVEWDLLVRVLLRAGDLPVSTKGCMLPRTVYVLEARRAEEQKKQAEEAERRKGEEEEQEVEEGVEAMRRLSSLFDTLCSNGRYGTVVECFQSAVQERHLQLAITMMGPLMRTLAKHQQHARTLECFTHAVRAREPDVVTAMLELIMSDHREVLWLREWGAASCLLLTFLPGLFQHLIARLQTMPDDDVRSFVRALSLSTFRSGSGDVRAAQLGADAEASGKAPAEAPCLAEAKASAEAPAEAPCLAEAKASGEAPAAEAPCLDGAAEHATLLKMYHCLILGLAEADYKVIKAFYEETSQEMLNDMTAYPIYAKFVGLLAVDRQPSMAAEAKQERALVEGVEGLPATQRIPASPTPPSQLARDLRDIVAAQSGPCAPPSTASSHAGSLSGGSTGTRTLAGKLLGGTKVFPTTASTAGGDRTAAAGTGAAGAAKRLEPETLNVGRVLGAAVHSRMAHNVQAVVFSITRWADADGQAAAVFVTGISTDLLNELALRFPSACANLLNLLCRGMSGRLATVQVPATLLYDRTFRVKCSNVHSHFIWQDRQLRRLQLTQGYTETVVAALIDYGVPFDCVVKAAVERRDSAVDFAALIEEGFSGPELRLLISNNVPLAEICKYIATSNEPLPKRGLEVEDRDLLGSVSMSQLIRDMLRVGLNPHRVINVLLHTLVVDDALRKYFPKVVLILWQGERVEDWKADRLPPWDRRFIHKSWGGCSWDDKWRADPRTLLTSAFDDKLMDAQVYLEDKGEVDEEPLLDREAMREGLLLWAFVNPFWRTLHRWPVAALAWLLLYLRRRVLRPLWRGLHREAQAEHFRELVEARALVIPWRCIADMGAHIPQQRPAAETGPAPAPDRTGPSPSGADADVSRPPPPPPRAEQPAVCNRGVLAALVGADVPVRWFGFTAVKAVVAVHWQEFGQTLMLLSALAHIMFMVLFIVFLFNFRNAGEQEAGDMGMVRKRPEVIALLGLLGLLSVGGLLEEGAQVRELTLSSWRSHPGNIVDLTSFALVFVIHAMVWGRSQYGSILAVCAIEALVLFIRLVFFASMTDSMGSLMRMVIEIIKDMRYFFVLLGMIFGGFAIAFAALQGPSYSYEATALKLFSVMLGDWSADYLGDMLHTEGNWYMPLLSVILMSVYGVLVLIVLVNLLIAIMNDTYDRIKETEEIEVLRNHAHLIVGLESLLTEDMRTKLQKQLLGDYLHVLIPADRVTDFMSSSETGEDDWKGRMRAFRETVRRDMEPQLQGIRATCDTSRADIISTLVQGQALQAQLQTDVQSLVQAQAQLQTDVKTLVQAQAQQAQALVSSQAVAQEELRALREELTLMRQQQQQQGGLGA